MMHELHRAEKLKQDLEKRGIEKKVEVHLSHIEKTLITLEEVSECFALVTKGTKLEGSKLIFEAIPTLLVCERCKTTYNEPIMECRNCGSYELHLNEEDELIIQEIRELS